MIDANSEVCSEVSLFIGNKDAAQETFSGSLLHRFCAELLLTLPATHHEPTSCPDGGGPTWRHTTGNWRRIDFVALHLQWLSVCSNAHTWQHGELALQDREDHRAASLDVSLQLLCSGQPVNRNFASGRALKLPDVAHRSDALWRSVPSWPQHWHIDRMDASFTKLARIIFGTVAPPEKRCPKAEWITSDTWAAVELHRDCRHHFFARIRQRKSLLLLRKQGRTLLAIVWSLHCKHAFCSLLQSRQQRRLKQTVVLCCAAKPPTFKRIPTKVCPLPFGLLSGISPRKRREGVPNQLLFSGLHRVTLQVRLRIWPGCGKTPCSVRSIDGERSLQHVPVFPLPLRCLTPPLRLLSLMPFFA